MRTRMMLALGVPMILGLCTGRAIWADVPRTDSPTAVKEAPKIAESDRWFMVAPDDEANAKINLHIAVRKSDRAEAPVRVTYEINVLESDGLVRGTIENLCLNDEWLSPVKFSMSFKGDSKQHPPPMSATITRPDPKSTAGKMKVEGGHGGSRPEQDIKEHTVSFFAPLDMVLRMPFDKDKELVFAVLDVEEMTARDSTLSYAGEEEIEVKGQKQKAHKFVQKIGEGEKPNQYWLDARHQLIRADIKGATLTPATKEEALKAVEGEKTAEPAK